MGKYFYKLHTTHLPFPHFSHADWAESESYVGTDETPFVINALPSHT